MDKFDQSRTTVFLNKKHLVMWKALNLGSLSEFVWEQMAERLDDTDFIERRQLERDIQATKTKLSMLERHMRRFKQEETDARQQAEQAWDKIKHRAEELNYTKEKFFAARYPELKHE